MVMELLSNVFVRETFIVRFSDHFNTRAFSRRYLLLNGRDSFTDISEDLTA